MSTTLATQSTTVKRILHDPSRGRVIVVSASGVDIYRISDWTRVAWAALANVTCAAINDSGIFLGTSDAGVYRLPLTASGASTASLVTMFRSGAAVELTSYNIKDLAGYGSALAVVTAAEFFYMPDIGIGYEYTGGETPLLCALNDTYLAWATDSIVEITEIPTDDFDSSDISIGDEANRLAFEIGTDNLLICHAAGLRLVDCTDPGTAGGLSKDGLVAHWTFDAASGTTVYDETGGYNGTLVGGATAGSTTGQIGKALGLDGNDDAMTFSSLGIFNNSLSFSCWVHFNDETPASDEYVWRSGEYVIGLRRETDGTLYFFGYNTTDGTFGAQTAASYGTGTYHIAGRWTKASKFELFVNGVLAKSTTTSYIPESRTETNAIGSNQGTASFLDGWIDEFRFYNRLLADDEIADLYQQTDLVAPRPGLVSYYTMDAISGTILYDEEGTQNGTISGATQVDGYLGKALSCDGTNDFADLGSSSLLPETAAWSIVGWFKNSQSVTAIIYAQYYASNGYGRFLIRRSDSDTSKLAVFLGSDDVGNSTVNWETGVINNSVWNFFCVTRSGADFVCNFNGTKYTLNDSATRKILQTGCLLGARSGSGSVYNASLVDYFAGQIEGVRVYNRAISDEEIAGLHAETILLMPKNGLVAHWSMDSINGTTIVEEGGNYDATNNGATQVDGRIIKALSFDGTNDFAEIPHNSALKPTAAISYMAWAYRADWSSAGNTRLISCTESGGWSFEFDNVTVGNLDASIQISGTYYNAVFTYTGLSPGWHFFVATCDGRYVKLYVDGELKDTEDKGSTGSISYTYDNSIIIGGEAGTGTGCEGNYFSGLIDAVRIFNRAISAAEIAILYMEGIGSYGINYDATDLGTVTDCQDAWKEGDCIAYGTSNGSDGGRFGIMELDEDGEATSKTTVASTDTLAVWLQEAVTAAIRDNQLERYRLVAEISPGADARDVRRDWTLYAEITDSLGGIQSGTVALKVNGTSQTPTTSAITNGYAVTYTPGSNSGYAERVTIEISGTDSDNNTVSRTWTFTTTAAPALTATDAAPPNVTCIRDIDLTTAESDETVGSVNVVWLETHTSPLIVTEAQAKEVGRVKIDETTYHKHKVGVKVLALDAGDLQTRDLRPGSIATITCNALGMSAQKCEILAVQRNIGNDEEDISFDLLAAYYEQVWT